MVLRKLIAYYLKNMSGPLIVNLLGDGARTNEVYIKKIYKETLVKLTKFFKDRKNTRGTHI